MKGKKAHVEKASAGTVLAARMRVEGNELPDAEREKLGEEFLKPYRDCDKSPKRT